MGTWSFVLIPDTQYLASNYATWGPGHFNGMRDWIAANIGTHNIKFIGGLGDIVDDGSIAEQWPVATTALHPLTELGIPALFPHGNHDLDNPSGGMWSATWTAYDTHFGPGLYNGKPWFGGVKDAGSAKNAYALFSAGERDYLLIQTQEYTPGEVVRWVHDLARQHPDRRVIILTHVWLRRTGQRAVWEWGARTPADRFLAPSEMWDAYGYKRIPNLWAIFNGHFSGNVAYRIDPNDSGRKVLQGFYNFQWLTEGGRGRVMLMTVDDAAGTIHQRVVRTDLNSFETGTDTDGTTVFDYDTTHDMKRALPPGDYFALSGGNAQGVAGSALTIT